MFPFFTIDSITSKKAAKYENDMEFQNVFYNLLNIALYSFSFEGLPKTCNERYFKLCLLLHGSAALINDPELGFLSLGCTPMTAGDLNIYGEWPIPKDVFPTPGGPTRHNIGPRTLSERDCTAKNSIIRSLTLSKP